MTEPESEVENVGAGASAGGGVAEGVGEAGTLSPDGRWQWDGHQWMPAYPPDDSTPYPGTPGAPELPPDQLDLTEAPHGDLPDQVDDLPGEPTSKTMFVAIGTGWIAVRRLHWHLMRTSAITEVGISPPSIAAEASEAFDRSMKAASPRLVLSDQSGHVMSFDLGKLHRSMVGAIASQLPSSTQVGPAAAQYFETGQLPGDWGKPYQFLGHRFG